MKWRHIPQAEGEPRHEPVNLRGGRPRISSMVGNVLGATRSTRRGQVPNARWQPTGGPVRLVRRREPARPAKTRESAGRQGGEDSEDGIKRRIRAAGQKIACRGRCLARRRSAVPAGSGTARRKQSQGSPGQAGSRIGKFNLLVEGS